MVSTYSDFFYLGMLMGDSKILQNIIAGMVIWDLAKKGMRYMDQLLYIKPSSMYESKEILI